MKRGGVAVVLSELRRLQEHDGQANEVQIPLETTSRRSLSASRRRQRNFVLTPTVSLTNSI
jgi:hypothetical protein